MTGQHEPLWKPEMKSGAPAYIGPWIVIPKLNEWNCKLQQVLLDIAKSVRKNARAVEDLVENIRTNRCRRAREERIWMMTETAEEKEKSERVNEDSGKRDYCRERGSWR